MRAGSASHENETARVIFIFTAVGTVVMSPTSSSHLLINPPQETNNCRWMKSLKMQYSQLLSLILCPITLVLILLIFLSGINKHVLVDNFFLKADISGLSIPAALANSTYLKDLSSVTGNDLVGPDQSASSLGLADSYTVSLLTACGKDANCTKPEFGFHFDPITDLQLDASSFSSDFRNSLSAYATTSKFLAIGYILGFAFTLITPIFVCFSSRSNKAAFIGATTAFLAMVFLLAASGAATGIFTKVKGSFNDGLEPLGIKTALGNKLFILSWVATISASTTTILLCVFSGRSRQAKKRGNALLNRGSMDKNGNETHVVGGGAGLKKLSLLQRMPTWNRHKYAQVEKGQGVKAAITGKEVLYDDEDRDVLLTRGFGGGDDHEDEPEDRALIGGQSGGIQLQHMARGPGRDMDTAYEPFRHQGSTAL